MPRITPIHWKKFEKFLLHTGCEFVRQKGDHRIYSRIGLARPIVVPEYDQLPVFVIKNNLRVLDIDPKTYLEMLRKMK